METLRETLPVELAELLPEIGSVYYAGLSKHIIEIIASTYGLASRRNLPLCKAYKNILWLVKQEKCRTGLNYLDCLNIVNERIENGYNRRLYVQRMHTLNFTQYGEEYLLNIADDKIDFTETIMERYQTAEFQNNVLSTLSKRDHDTLYNIKTDYNTGVKNGAYRTRLTRIYKKARYHDTPVEKIMRAGDFFKLFL